MWLRETSLKCFIATRECTEFMTNLSDDCMEICKKNDFFRGLKAELSLDFHKNWDY